MTDKSESAASPSGGFYASEPHPENPAQLPPTPWGKLPPTIRVLLITAEGYDGTWLEDAMTNDQATVVAVQQAMGIGEGLAYLRDRAYETVLIVHDPDRLDSLEVLDAIRTGSSPQQPILVLGHLPSSDMTSVCFEAGADGYLCLSTTTSRDLIWQIARAAERQRLIAENDRLRRANKNQISMELDETERLLQQQRDLLSAGIDGDPDIVWPDQEADWICHYRELLRTYVVMGHGNLSSELRKLAKRLLDEQISADLALRGHLQVLHEAVRDLGAKSARHVMNRGALLILEVLRHMADAPTDVSTGLPSPVTVNRTTVNAHEPPILGDEQTSKSRKENDNVQAIEHASPHSKAHGNRPSAA